ncbi:response regulator [Saccharothrix sp. ALI-22-I]|uniref:response regulator n=1 Tax=Saccharothrix sp. ALI-22-I TaxID=1933778 RepID=UPI001EE72B1B|nr:response regulator [Saccharothrix sp. ALI-22-I]
MLRRYLERDGHVTAIAHDGRTAIEMARRRSPDLLVLDLVLPVVDGLDVCRVLRAENGVPVIMLTARTSEDDLLLGLAVGADDPFTVTPTGERVDVVDAKGRYPVDPSNHRAPLFSRGGFGHPPLAAELGREPFDLIVQLAFALVLRLPAGFLLQRDDHLTQHEVRQQPGLRHHGSDEERRAVTVHPEVGRLGGRVGRVLGRPVHDGPQRTVQTNLPIPPAGAGTHDVQPQHAAVQCE